MTTPALPPPPAHDAARCPAAALRRRRRRRGSLLGVPVRGHPGRPAAGAGPLPAARRRAGRLPVVVFLHGGGWRVGSRHTAGPGVRAARAGPFERVARAGIAVASVDYRLSGEAVWPAQLHDAKAAVRWLRARAGELGIDPDRIAAWGESAGGHLAELLGLTGDDAGAGGGRRHDRAVEPRRPPSSPGTRPATSRAVATDTGADPADATTREALLLGAAAADRARRWPRRPARSATSPPAHRRSCCCTARPTGSSRPCRASGCTRALVEAGVEVGTRPVRGRRPHVAGLARGGRAGARPARSTSCAGASLPSPAAQWQRAVGTEPGPRMLDGHPERTPSPRTRLVPRGVRRRQEIR